MSFTEGKRDNIKQHLLNTVYRYVHELEHAMIIEQKDGKYHLIRV